MLIVMLCHCTEEVGGTYAVTLSRSLSAVHHYPRVLDFSTFTSQGMRRTLGDEERRFITPAKLLALITACDGLMAFGASESMDSALSREVLEGLVSRLERKCGYMRAK